VGVRPADRKHLEARLRTHSIPRALAARARIVLGSAAGESIRAPVRPDHRAGHPPRQLRQRARAGGSHNPLAGGLEPKRAPVSLDQIGRADQTQHSQRCTHLRDGTLGPVAGDG
jgi:hypothetical protein